MSSECDIAASKAMLNGLAPGSDGRDKEMDPTKICTGKGAVTLRASSSYRETPSSGPVSPQETPQRESQPDDWRLSSSADANGNAQPSSLAAKGYRSVHPNLPSDKPQDASSSSPAKPEVIVVPLYLVNTDRGHEGTARPAAPPGTPGCVHPVPATASAASPLTFPTLDDFIPPHLQRRPHPSPPASACGSLPPGSHTPPSFSPPPPLVPPAPEDLHSGSEPDLTGAVPSTVSLPAPSHGLPGACALPAVTARLSLHCSVPV